MLLREGRMEGEKGRERERERGVKMEGDRTNAEKEREEKVR